MAESITEGTLKTWSKQVGDSVAADEEVATIETDKIDVSVNAPQAGKIVELLAKEEDTVTVGQDLFRIEPGECAFYIYLSRGWIAEYYWFSVVVIIVGSYTSRTRNRGETCGALKK
jgi:Biotin-requiring enzyme